MSLELERRKLREVFRQEKKEMMQRMPSPPPLNMKILEKRHGRSYEEWRIEYTVEHADTMPLLAGQKVSAYVMIPKKEEYQAPFPAMLCFHQCAVDCVLGKEAVVGKAFYRPDQAYGFELVESGFVVLAPDSINCGERHISAIRQPGENRQCVSIIDQELGRSRREKHIYDGIRAIDLLQSLDFVDPDRIGAIGHSMGSGNAFDVMLYDSRIQAGIMSGGGGQTTIQYLPLYSPRFVMALRGSRDYPAEENQAVEKEFENAQKFYEEDNASGNLILRTLMCGHHFLDEFRWEAFGKLKQYFGMTNPTVLSLQTLLETTRKQASKNPDLFPEIQMSDSIQILADEKQLIQAFLYIFYYLWNRRYSEETPLIVEVQEQPESYEVVCCVYCSSPAAFDQPQFGWGEGEQIAEKLLAENNACFQRANTTDQLRFLVSFKKPT